MTRSGGYILDNYADAHTGIIASSSRPWESDPDAIEETNWHNYSQGLLCADCGAPVTNGHTWCQRCQPANRRDRGSDLPKKLRRLQARARQMADGPRRELVRLALVATVRDIVRTMTEDDDE